MATEDTWSRELEAIFHYDFIVYMYIIIPVLLFEPGQALRAKFRPILLGLIDLRLES